MPIFSVDTVLGVADLGTNDTTQQWELGKVVSAKDSVIGDVGEYVYCKYGATITVGQIVTIDHTSKCALASSTNQANDGCPLAIAVAATGADNSFGWFKISGKAKVKAGTVAAGGKVFLTATAGTVDDAAVNGSQVIGAVFETADGTPAAGFAYANINRPTAQTQVV